MDNLKDPALILSAVDFVGLIGTYLHLNGKITALENRFSTVEDNSAIAIKKTAEAQQNIIPVPSLVKAIDETEGTIKKARGDIKTIGQRVQSLEERMDTIETRFSALTEQLIKNGVIDAPKKRTKGKPKTSSKPSSRTVTSDESGDETPEESDADVRALTK